MSVSVRFEPRGSRWRAAVGVVLEGELARSVALLLASCLVSKGVGVDGARDSLTARVERSNGDGLLTGVRVQISDVDVKKKVKGLRVTLASLRGNSQTGQLYLRCTE